MKKYRHQLVEVHLHPGLNPHPSQAFSAGHGAEWEVFLAVFGLVLQQVLVASVGTNAFTTLWLNR